MLVFPEAYRKLQDKVKIEVPVLVRGGVRIEEGANPKLTVNDISSLEEVKVPLPRALRIRVPLEKTSETTIDELHVLFSQRKGDARVLFDVERKAISWWSWKRKAIMFCQIVCSLAGWKNCADEARSE